MGIDLLVFLSLVRLALFVVQIAWREVEGESVLDKMKEREKKEYLKGRIRLANEQ